MDKIGERVTKTSQIPQRWCRRVKANFDPFDPEDMSSRSRSASVSSESSDSGQLFQAAKAAAARDSLQTQANVIPLAEQPQPVASTSKPPAEPILASGRKLPEDSFGQLPRPRLSKKAWKDSQDKSAGGKWFHMPAAPDKPSEELKREVKALKLGTAIDPKRFLRGEAKRDAGKLPEHFQVQHARSLQSSVLTD